MPQIAKVAVAAATYAIDKPYDYLVPQGADMAVGMRVLVPFGRGNRVSEGVVLTLGQGVPEKPIKPIRSLVDREPVITEREIRLALWMRERYFCTFYDAIRTILPAAVWYSYREMWSLTGEPLPEDLSERETAACRLLQDGPMERDDLCAALGETGSRVLAGLKKRGILQMEPQGTRKVQDKVVQIAALSLAPQEALRQMERKKKSAARQYDAVAFLAKYGDAPVQELCYYTGVSRQGVRSLERAGLLSLRSQEEYRITRQDYAAAAEEIRLNDEQQRAYEAVLAQTRSGCPGVTLLQGVTGSGKTLVYIRLAQTLLAEGRSVMILVPEIALTPQMMARFSAYFGDEVALLHSGLRLTERYDQWKRIRRGEAHIVLGTRSAVFAPLENLGLIILDEEQESSYESENPPCYHARDIAKYRCFRENARLLLGSATPTVETAYLARRGDYQLALQRAPDAPGDPGGYAAGAAGRQQRLHQPGADAGAGEEPGGRGAEHSVSQPPGQQPPAAVPPVRLCAPVSPVQRVSDVSLRQWADDVPLLRLFRKKQRDLPLLRRRHEAHWRRYPEGGGGAAHSVPRDGGSPHGCGHRQPGT